MNNPQDENIGEYRRDMVERIAHLGIFRGDAVRQAMGTVPRHMFVPQVDPETAYAEQSVTTKPGSGKRPLSCASGPRIVAAMLEQLQLTPGCRVLEIGAGTGYNAALLAELVGPDGQVTSLDVYPDVVDGARGALASTGYGRVSVIHRDGGEGCVERAPYDRIIVTVGPWDVPTAWFDQLRVGGILVAPLRWRGQGYSIAFVREADRLRSTGFEFCGFISMTGGDQDGERNGAIDEDGLVEFYWDEDQAVDPASLRPTLASAELCWSGVVVGSQERVDGIWLRLTAEEFGVCRIAADRAAVESGLCKPAIPVRSPVLVEGSSMAYLAKRPCEGEEEPMFELGAICHGERGLELGQRLCAGIQRWSSARTAFPEVTVIPRTSEIAVASAEPNVIRKPSGYLCLAYPPAP